MNLLLINYEYPPVGGGAANATQAIGRSLVRKGHEVRVLTSGLTDSPTHSVEEGIQVYRLRGSRARADRSTFVEMISFITKSSGAAISLHRTRPLDASIAFFTIPSGPASLQLHRHFKVPFLVSLRGGDVPGHVPGHRALHLITLPYRRAILRSASTIVANSENLAASSRNADPFRVRVIPNGVDCSVYRPREKTEYQKNPSRPFRLLYVGRIHPEKNLGLVIEQLGALLKMGRSEIELSVAGDGAQRAELEALAEKLGVGRQVIWLGWKSKEELPSLYCQADALVNPSLYEGMPNVVLEAMATGIPVIASDVAGNRSVVIPNETGVLFPLNTPDMLGASIARFIDEPRWAASLGTAGRRKAESIYSWDSAAQSYLELLASVTAG